MDHGGQRAGRVMTDLSSDEDHQTSTNSNSNIDSAESEVLSLLGDKEPHQEADEKFSSRSSVKDQHNRDEEKVHLEGGRDEDTQKCLLMTSSPHPHTGPSASPISWVPSTAETYRDPNSSTCSRKATSGSGEEESITTVSSVTPPGHVLLRALEKLAQREEDIHLPHYLHQIAEALVLQKDYQLALCCIHLEALYHHRLLDNLRMVQQRWESLCRPASSSHLQCHLLDSLRHICQTHTRPSSPETGCVWTVDCLGPGGGAGASWFPESVAEYSLELYSATADQQPGLKNTEFRPQLTDEKAGVWESEAEGRAVVSSMDCCLDQSSAEDMDQTELQRPIEKLSSREQVEAKWLEQDGKKQADEQQQNQVEEQQQNQVEEQQQNQVEEQQHIQAEERQHIQAEERQQIQAEERQHIQAEERQQIQAEERQQKEHQVEDQQENLAGKQEENQTKKQLPYATPLIQRSEGEEEESEDETGDVMKGAALLDILAKQISVEEVSHTSGLVSILKRRSECEVHSKLRKDKSTARRVRFEVADDEEPELGSGDSCLLLFLLCLVTVVVSLGGTALYCALGDAHSSVCQDFSRNADFYVGHIQHHLAHLQQWFGSAP